MNYIINLETLDYSKKYWLNEAKNLVTSEIIDVTGKGISDIKNKIIRMVTEDSMKEDPLRQLRAVQLSSRLSFKM